MKNTLLFIWLFLSFWSCSKPQLTIIKQWHLAPSTNTLEIEQGKHLPQYGNQKEIFDYLQERIQKNNKQSIIVEGCEGEIKEDFDLKFNGWNIKLLQNQTSHSQYDTIMTQVGIKLKAKYPEAKIICGDSLELIEKNARAFSELRGHLGFLTKMVNAQNLNQEVVFKKYAEEYLKLYPGKLEDVISLAKFHTDQNLKLVEKYINLRNESFVNVALKELQQDREVVIVIGGLHFQDLKEKLKNHKLAFFEYIPQTYDQNEEELLSKFKKLISGIGEKSLVFFQVPQNFAIDKFPFKNLFKWEDITNESEKEKLQETLLKAKLPEEVILSDFDADGIRDFTLSEGSNSIVISAEDDDWDNDGEKNLIDETLAKVKFPPTKLKNIQNIFNVKLDKNIEQTLKNYFNKKNIKLINHEGQSHDIYLLFWLKKILEFYDHKFKIAFINATKPSIQYGQDVYFSYIPQSNSLEIYVENFKRYVKNKQQDYVGVSEEKFINGFITPVIVHSLLHELYHSLHIQNENIPGWNYKEESLASTYLTQKRLQHLSLKKQLHELKYLGKTKNEWDEEIKEFESYRTNLAKKFSDPKIFKQHAIKSKYYTSTKSLDREFQLSLLNKYKIPSYYSLSKPSEYQAEIFAACEIHHFIKNIDSLEEGIRMEILIGFNTTKRCK